jgi:lipopolysaccharide/colanic/teichoic acid biosynthesis glycosyltransferase
MQYKMTHVSTYHNSLTKKVLNYSFSLLGILVSIPISILIAIAIKLTSKGEVIFRQKRIGKKGKEFEMIKFRTMVTGADRLQNKYMHLNVSDGPTFKIPKDPRYTRFGKYLVKTGFDELPQLINVLRGEMAIVGPRPLPNREAKHLTEEQKLRELVLPGITSSWVISGAHNLKFKKWMESDIDYVQNATLLTDMSIMFNTVFLITRLTVRKITKFFIP